MDATPIPSLDRQIEFIQFRIQQAIDLHDDEIERLLSRLVELKSAIVESKDAIGEVERKIMQAIEFKKGEAKRRETLINSICSRAQTNHIQQIQELHQSQSDEIDALQQGFVTELEKLSDSWTQAYPIESAKIQQEIDKLQKYIENMHTQMQEFQMNRDKIELETAEEYNKLDFNVIEQLHEAIRNKNQERIISLQQSKEKLSQAIAKIEELDRLHYIKVTELEKQIAEIELTNERQLAKINEKHQHKLINLKGHLDEAEKRAQVLKRAAHHLEYSNQKQLHETMKGLDQMRSKTLANLDTELIKPEDYEKCRLLKKEFDKKQKYLAQRDQILQTQLQINEQYKREMGRLKHLLRYSRMDDII